MDAELAASKLTEAHKRAVQAARPLMTQEWRPDYTPGKHPGPDGGEIIASATDLIYLDASGAFVRTAPNGGLRSVASSIPRLGLNLPVDLCGVTDAVRPTLVRKDSDDAIFQTYLDHGGPDRAGIHDFDRGAAVKVWEVFKSVINKPLRDCSREDGRKLAQHFLDAGNSTATVKKKINRLGAACKLAVDEGLLKFNPFSGVTPTKVMIDGKLQSDKKKRVGFSPADIDLIKANLGTLSNEYQLLVKLLATTGMRLGEALAIKSEVADAAVRHVWVGSKTDSSWRPMPFPESMLPLLPAKIDGLLFPSIGVDRDTATKKQILAATNDASHRLNGRFIKKIGIVVPPKCKKDVHSFRHLAETRLRDVGCPKDWREAILGHLKGTSDGYGEFPVAKLKSWSDSIGF